MTVSIWRYSHLVLALASALFLVLASLTGIVLAFEPIQQSVKPYHLQDLGEISLAETLEALNRTYDETLTLGVDANDFVTASVVTHQGDSETIYIDPRTGKKLGTPEPQHPIFQFATNLHRSLFLKSTGRVFVGLVSFLLCLLAVTGLLLIIKRQGGLRKLFSKVQKDYFELRYHVILGRWFLLPIIIVAATGVYLSAEKFSLLPDTTLENVMTIPETVDYGAKPSGWELFEKIKLDELRSVTFPFSEFPEDYFELYLRKKEMRVHQYTGEILSEAEYPFSAFASRWSLILHTGQGSILWSLVLLMLSISILYFIYSGTVMWLKRIKSTRALSVTVDKDECSHVILVGSETGNTFVFARHLQQALIEAGKTVFVSELNGYTTYDKAEHLIVLTSTYGEGDAPANARNFQRALESVRTDGKINYSVVGFGSLLYPDYCKFASQVDRLLRDHPNFNPLLPIYKINDRSFEAFKDWVAQWVNSTGTVLSVKPLKNRNKPVTTQAFTVVNKTGPNLDGTVLIRLRPENKTKFQSGDLLAYSPEKNEMPRLYSIARMEGDILLSIKRHELGVCSNYFSELSENDRLHAGIRHNPEFHFPRHVNEIVCIANGTGIAPFLGMVDENTAHIPMHLFWGGRTQASYETYREYIETALSNQKLSTIEIAYSREFNECKYVQDLISKAQVELAEKLRLGAVFMICGSIAMQNEVLGILEKITESQLNTSLSEFENNEQLKMDCY